MIQLHDNWGIATYIYITEMDKPINLMKSSHILISYSMLIIKLTFMYIG